jgi:hypothetical protein
MKKIIVSMFMILSFMVVNVGMVAAADVAKKGPSPAQLAQQEKMKSCNKQAAEKALKGDARKAFMKTCLSGKTTGAPVVAATVVPAAKPVVAATAVPAVKPATQQDKMKLCNKEAAAKKLKGDARKKFMSECLKK